MRAERKIVLQPSGRTVYALPGTHIFEVAARAGVILRNPCGGKGTCGKCRVRLAQGACEPTAACRAFFSAEELAAGYRLACQARIVEDAVIEIPSASLFDGSGQILTAGSGGDSGNGQPAVRKTFVCLPKPTSADHLADLNRLERALGITLDVHLDVLRRLPERLRKGDFCGTAVTCCSRLLDFEPGNSEAQCYGVAFDLGTTTLVGTLVDLAKHCEVAVSATMNPQISDGDDVISRITRVREHPAALGKLQAAVIRTFNELIVDLTEKTGVERQHVYEVAVAGNTTMQHLFCGISPAALGEVPFPPVLSRALQLEARHVGLDVHPDARLYVFPNIGGFVGGDTVAGIVANALHASAKPRLFVDIGTNGEIVLAHAGRLMATSTAAGPAFEGARIVDGMRAAPGAIEKVVMNGTDIAYNVIGNRPPTGLCGTALIDVTAELLRLGVLDETGRILSASELPDSAPRAIRARLHEHGDHVDFLLADTSETGTGKPIYLYQRDVRELQLASGAIRAGINIMLRMAGIEAAELDEILLAGGFGNFIRRSNARRIGLLPAVPTERIRFVGNASAIGAKAVLLSEDLRPLAEHIAATAEHVDLSLDAEFQMEFGMAMMFPDAEFDG